MAQIRVDRDLAERVVVRGAPALDGFELTPDEAAAVVDALRLDVRVTDDEVAGFSFSFGMPLDNVIGVGRQLGVQGPGVPGGDWIDRGGDRAGWIERLGPEGSQA